MPTFTILPHAWVKENYRLKPALRSLFMGLALLFGLASQALATTWNVPGDYATIQLAIDNVLTLNGDIITVDANTYTEQINLNKAITIRGANWGQSAGAVPEARGAETIIDGGFIVSAAATLDGLKIIKGRTSGSVKVGVAVTVDGVSILNCIIQDVGMVPLTAQSDGISTEPNNDNLILTDSKIFNNWRGIYLNPGNGHTFTGNLIDANNGVGVGIGSDGQSNFMLTGNIISNHTVEGWGSSAVGANVKAENNQFLNNGVSVAHYGGSAIDASPNYWGSANPDFNVVKSGNVTYDPWWSDVAMTMLESNNPVHNLTQNTFHATISAAITAAAAMDVIELDPGTYNEKVVIDKKLTLQGQNEATCIIDGTSLGVGSGIFINTGITNVTIKYLTVQDFAGTNPGTHAGIWANQNNNNLTVQNVTIKDNVGGSGFYANGIGSGVDNVTLNNLDVSGHTNVNGAARGIVIWNGLKSNITITNCDVYNNNCCGIELQDGDASGVTMNNNNVHDNGDNGIGLVGLNGSVNPNVISNNTVTNNGRFGIEIKNPNGATTVKNNTVSRTLPIGGELRDIVGIAVFRRAVTGSNVDVPSGVTVKDNNVSGYVQISNSDGFGIVIEGTYHTVTGNTLTSNDVGLQLQKGHTPAPPPTTNDGDQSNLNDDFFGRGNSQTTECNAVYDNIFVSNTLDTREKNGPYPNGFVKNDNTGVGYCTIQAAINAAIAGHKLIVAPGTYAENVIINKAIILEGANANIACGSRGTESIIAPASGVPFTVSAGTIGVTINGFEITAPTAPNAIVCGNTSDLSIKYNKIHGIGTTVSGSHVHAINYTVANSPDRMNVSITDNCFDNIGNNSNHQHSTSAIGILQSTTLGVLTNLNIERNTINNVLAKKVDWSLGGRIANGISINVGGNANFPTNGKVVNAIIRNNEISNLEGFISTAIGLEGNTENAIVENNSVSNLKGYKNDTRPNGGYDLSALKFESNRYVSTCVVQNNSFQTNTFENNGTPNLGYAISNYVTVADGGEASLTCNWFGTAVYNDILDNPTMTGKVFNKASCVTNVSPFLVNGTDNLPATKGFQPTPNSCTGGPVKVYNGITFVSAHDAIQEAIDAGTTLSGYRIRISSGTYTENVNAVTGGKNITFVPGNSPGCVTINGNYTLNAGDILEMEIEGTTPCTQHDQFIVNGVVTLNGATLTLPMGMYFAQDGDQIVLIDNDLTDAVIGRFAQGNFATDGTNQYYINYEGGSGNDVVLTKCCGALVDIGIFTTTIAPMVNPPAKDVLAGHKLLIKARPTADMVNAIYTQGTFTIRTLATNGVVNFAGDNVHSDFGYVQVGSKQTIALYDYFIFNFENGDPDELNWLKMVEYNLLTLTYSCAVGNAVFELVTNPADPNAPVGGKFYQEVNGETNPGAQGIFYAPRVSVTGPGVLAITATSNSPVCETMQIDLNSTTTGGSPTYAPYAWSGPNMYVSALADPIPFTATLAPLTAGIYQVSVTDGNGCTATATTTVVVPATGACVQNETNMPNNYYPTIKQAIDAVATITGDVLNVPAGTWPENVYVNKALTLNGVYKDISCDDVTRTGAESIITGGAGIAVAIQSNNVTINGFQLEGSTGVSSTGFNEVTIKNNKVNVREIGIASTLLVASALDPYSINDNCVDFPVQAFDQQAFNVNPTLSATQAPGVWYTDRYAPAGFVSTGVPTFRLKHSINASDCETCRPIAFQTAFYNTQGRKYDVGGTTAMSIQLYVATGWDVTNKRMAGFWGTALNAGNAISFYPIIEFTSDGSNPRFRGWNGVAFVDMGLPAGFAYDKWYTLNIAIDGTTIRYNVGDLSLILPGNGSVSIANVILQGHNTLAGVTYDINWDNLNTHGSDDTQTAPTVGILLAAASGTDDVTVQDNNVTDGFYGYVLSGVTAASADRTTVKGGTYTNLLQGVAVLNTLDGVNFAPSSVGVENVAFESFGGNYPNIPAANFHAGIYGFTGGSNPAHTVDILIKSVSLKNTGKTSQASAGLYLADFSTGAGNRLNATATLSTIQDNKNRGVQVRGANATASVSTSHILGNGADPFGAGGNHGFGIYSGVGAQVTLLNNFIANPAVQISDNVTALYEGVAPAATIIAHDNSIVRNSNGLLANTTSGTINGTNGSTTCNWWGNSNPNVFDEFILGAVTYDPYLPSGVDDDANPANGFQPDVPCQDLTDFYVNDNSLTGDLITFAVGLDAPLTRGTAHRPYRHINAAIGAAANGNTIRVDIGTYSDEQVLVNKDLTILGTTGSPAAQPLIDFTGAVTGKPTLMDVSVDGATIENIGFNVDLAKLKSAIIVSGVAIDNIEVLDNVIDAYGTPVSGNYGDRNAVSINYGGSTNYRVASGGVNSITFTGNTVNGALPESFFRAGVAVDEGGGTFSDNTLQTINHDIIVRFANNGNVTISDNTLNGGGVELSDNNGGAGIFLVSNNDFDGTMSNSVTPRTAVLRLKNNQQDKVTTVSGNTFINHLWAISEENYKNVTVDNNDFTPLAGSTDFLHVGVNTKSISSNSNTIVQTTINGIFTNNVFNGSGTPGGTGIGFFNHDSDNDMIGTFTVGTNLNENEFAATIGVFARLDNQLGSTDPATFPTNYPDGGGWLTTMACWDVDVNLTHNKFDVGSGLQKPLAMNNAQRVLLEAKLFHKPDDACLGKFFQTVEVMAKVFLQGPYDGPSGKMNDNLRTLGGFPTSEPYTGINASFLGSFVEVNNTVLETITGSLSNLGDNSIVDWIWLELRDKNNSNTTLFTRSALVQRDGDIVDMDGSSEVAFPNAYQDNYFLMVRHRNHLAAMTAATVDLTNAGTMIDFTTAAQATFGTTSTSARRLIKTATYGLWAGNTFPKDEVGNGGAFRLLYNGSNNDRAPILTKVGFSTPLNVVTGYFIEDVNMNGEVKYSGSNNDRVIILNNVGASTPLNFITQEPNN